MSLKIAIGIPSYQRPNDLSYLLLTIKNLSYYPDEIIVADDNSPDQDKISEVISEYRSFFLDKGINFTFIKNNENLGYDKNLKIIINATNSEYLMFIGNDDAVDTECIKKIKSFLNKNQCNACSRSFWRFHNRIDNPFGKSWFFRSDHIFNQGNSDPNFYYRLGAYFGGLVFDRRWAKSKETDIFDGSLYYQIYLLACAYYEGGIGYISYPIVGARIEGIPLFGSAKSEESDHSPGVYSAKSRAAMWKAIISISDYVDHKYDVNSRPYIIHELKTRMSFHLLETYSKRKLSDLMELYKELNKLHLVNHFIPVILFLLVALFRSHSLFFFNFVRKIYQR